MDTVDKRILIIEPPFYRLFKNNYSLDRYPLSLGYLAAIVKARTDWTVATYNADFYPESEFVRVSYLAGEGFGHYLENLHNLRARIWQEILTGIQDFSPSVVGITSKSQNFASACNIARLVKKTNPNILVIVGGPHPSMVGEEVLKIPEIDIAVQGEGELTLLEILRTIENNHDFSNIAGIVFRRNGQSVANSARNYITSLDELPFPQTAIWGVLRDAEKYPRHAFGNLFAIRGCPFNCFFCGSRKIWSRQVRFRSPENVVAEIQGMQNLGLKVVHFDDDTFGVSKQHIFNLCEAIRTHCPGVKWSCEIPVTLIDDEVIAMMKRGGCFSITIGVESGNNEMLRIIRKNITIEQTLRAAQIIKRHHLLLKTFFIVGFPQETEETLADTVRAMKKIGSDATNYSIFTPYPGTETYDFCLANNLIDEHYNSALHNHQSPANCFCLHIQPERFRQLISKIEKMVDRKNTISRVKRLFSGYALERIQESGLKVSMKKSLKVLLGN